MFRIRLGRQTKERKERDKRDKRERERLDLTKTDIPCEF